MGSETSRYTSVGERTARIDDLKRIQGIGPVIERQLYDAGIHRYSQLAALKPEQIAQLVADLPLLSVERIARQDWPGQARALAAELGQAVAGDTAGGSASAPRCATFTLELLLDDRGNIQRTRVAYMQGSQEQQWSGWNAEELLRFLKVQAGIEDMPPAMASASSSQRLGLLMGLPNRALDRTYAEEVPPASGQPPDAVTTGHSAQSAGGVWRLEIDELIIGEYPHNHDAVMLPAVPRVRAQLGYRLGGSGAHQLAARALRCYTQVIATDLASGRTIVLAGDQGQLVANQLEYLSTLEFALPDDGRYQLVGTVLIADAELVGSTLGPVLRVVP